MLRGWPWPSAQNRMHDGGTCHCCAGSCYFCRCSAQPRGLPAGLGPACKCIAPAMYCRRVDIFRARLQGARARVHSSTTLHCKPVLGRLHHARAHCCRLHSPPAYPNTAVACTGRLDSCAMHTGCGRHVCEVSLAPRLLVGSVEAAGGAGAPGKRPRREGRAECTRELDDGGGSEPWPIRRKVELGCLSQLGTWVWYVGGWRARCGCQLQNADDRM